MKKEIEEFVRETTLFISLTLIIVGMYFFMAGIHSTDLAWNSYRSVKHLVDFTNNELKNSGADFEISLEGQTDIGSDFSEKTLEEVYIHGHNQTKLGFFLALAGAFFTGFSVRGTNGTKNR